MSRKRVSSRLAKREQKKLAKQTFFIILTTIILLIGFLYFILPNIVRFAFNVIESDPVAQIGDNIPPQVPILAAPVAATNSAQLKISGFGEAKSKVILVVNGDEVGEETIGEEGQFEFETELLEGENSISTYSIDEAENESLTSKSYTVIFDNEAPNIEITSPEEGSTITLRRNQLTTITGTTEPRAKVFINGKLNFANSEGEFSGTHNLEEGDNTISIVAEDEAGNRTETELNVKFEI